MYNLYTYVNYNFIRAIKPIKQANSHFNVASMHLGVWSPWLLQSG